MRRASLFLSLLALALPTSSSRAELLTIKDFDPARHNRFTTDSSSQVIANPTFYGQDFDLSGVGNALGTNLKGNSGSSGSWGTLISSQYVLTANHFHGANGSNISFEVVDGSTVTTQTYQISSGARVGTTDLYVQKLAAPVAAGVNSFSIVADNPAGLLGKEFYVYGVAHALGRNVINGFGEVEVGTTTSQAFIYDYFDPATGTYANPSVGGDLARLTPWNSGGPSFVDINGQLALVGIHWFNYEPDDIENNPFNGSGDSYVSAYIDQINAAIRSLGGSSSDLVRVVPVPEPGTVALISLGLPAAFLLFRKARRNPSAS